MEEEQNPQNPEPSQKNTLTIILIAVIAALIAGIGVYFALMYIQGPDQGEPEEVVEEEESTPPGVQAPSFDEA